MYQMGFQIQKIWNNVSTSHTDGTTSNQSSLLNGVLGSTYENVELSNIGHHRFIDMSETVRID